MSSPRIVVGLDGSDDCGTGLQWAIEQAHHSGSEIIAAHVFYQPVPNSWPDEARQELLTAVRQQARESLDTWTEPLRSSDVDHRTIVVHGVPAEGLLQVAEDEQAGMIVVGRSGLGGLARLLLGSVSYHLVQESPIPVVVIPPPQPG